MIKKTIYLILGLLVALILVFECFSNNTFTTTIKGIGANVSQHLGQFIEK